MLEEYATPEVLRDAYSDVVTMTQQPNETERGFAQRLASAASRAGGVFSDKALSNVYLDGLKPEVSGMIAELRHKNTSCSDLRRRSARVGRSM